MSSIETDRFRQTLLEERKRIEDAIEYLHSENPGTLAEEVGDEAGSDNHLGDTATATLDREIDYSLEENSEHVLRAIDVALQRIEEGTYGTCVTCGRPIGEERLEARPWADQCIDCRRRGEGR
jgi:RNA polymerase-binding protein DksA